MRRKNILHKMTKTSVLKSVSAGAARVYLIYYFWQLS